MPRFDGIFRNRRHPPTMLVGRGGSRLHKQIVLAGLRLRSRRVIAVERRDQALGTPNLALAVEVRDAWNQRLADREKRRRKVAELLIRREGAADR